jgi:hypothetical protein
MKVSALVPAAPLTGGELVPIVQGGLARRASMEQVSDRLAELLPESFRGPPGASNATYQSLAAVALATVDDGTNLIWIAETGQAFKYRPELDEAFVAAHADIAQIDRAGRVFVLQDQLRADLDADDGASRISVKQEGDGARKRPAQAKLNAFALLSDYVSLQDLARREVGEIILDVDAPLTAGVALRSNQTLRGTGGRIILQNLPGANFEDGVLYNEYGSNINLIDVHIDASAMPAGVPGIRLLGVNQASIKGGSLKKCNLMLESYDNTIDRGIAVERLVIDMAGYLTTAVYLSGVRDVVVQAVKCFNGREGIGVYNGANLIRLVAVYSHHHLQDGFVIIAGYDINHKVCVAHHNRQSGFTTQRQTDGTNSRFATYEGCISYENLFDGFDLRGADAVPWGIDTGFLLDTCIARQNQGAGYYIVNAEGTTLGNSVGILNGLQNLLIDRSDRVAATGFRSISGAGLVPSGVNKAGIVVYNSDGVQLTAPMSGNWEGPSQDLGVAFTGSSVGGGVYGGDLTNNSAGSFYAPGNVVVDARVDALVGGRVDILKKSRRGVYYGECYTRPGIDFALTLPPGSQLLRSDAGGCELYGSYGGGLWGLFNTTPV